MKGSRVLLLLFSVRSRSSAFRTPVSFPKKNLLYLGTQIRMRAASLVFIVSLLFAAAAVASASASNAIAFRGGKAQSAKSDFSSALTAAVTPDFSFHADGLQWVRLDKVQSLNMNPMCSVQVLNKFLDSFDCAGPETFDKETAKKNYMKEVEQRAKDLKEDLDEKSLYAKKLSDDQDTQFAVKAVVWSVMSPLTFTLTFMLPGVGGTISGVLSKVVGFVVGIAFDTSIESISKFLQSDDKAFDKVTPFCVEEMHACTRIPTSLIWRGD